MTNRYSINEEYEKGYYQGRKDREKEILDNIRNLMKNQLDIINSLTQEQLQTNSRRNMMRKQWEILRLNLFDKELKRRYNDQRSSR